jgi:hypothetical protein
MAAAFDFAYHRPMQAELIPKTGRLRYFPLIAALAIAVSPNAAQQKHECMGTGHELGEAVDLGALNDKPVSLYGKDPELTKMVQQTQDIFNHPKNGGPAPMENYGPAGLYRDGKRITDRKLQRNHTDHIHIRISSHP